MFIVANPSGAMAYLLHALNLLCYELTVRSDGRYRFKTVFCSLARYGRGSLSCASPPMRSLAPYLGIPDALTLRQVSHEMADLVNTMP